MRIRPRIRTASPADLDAIVERTRKRSQS